MESNTQTQLTLNLKIWSMVAYATMREIGLTGQMFTIIHTSRVSFSHFNKQNARKNKHKNMPFHVSDPPLTNPRSTFHCYSTNCQSSSMNNNSIISWTWLMRASPPTSHQPSSRAQNPNTERSITSKSLSSSKQAIYPSILSKLYKKMRMRGSKWVTW